MKIHLYTPALALGALLAFAPVSAYAENKVIAKVDGVEITETDLKSAELEIGAELANIPKPQQRLVLLEFLIENQLLSQAAKKEKIDTQPDFQKRLAYYRKRAMRDIYFDKHVRKAVTDAEAKKIYDQEIKQIPKEEIRASHILVETEKEAKDILATLKKGGDFAKLAKEKSKGPSKTNGGDLNFFTKGRMVPAFEKAAFALKKDELSEPVKTQFGWHIIKLTDKRDRQLPKFEQVKDRLLQRLVQQKAQTTVRSLRAAAKIEVLDKGLDTQIKALRGSFSGQPKGSTSGQEKAEEKKK